MVEPTSLVGQPLEQALAGVFGRYAAPRPLVVHGGRSFELCSAADAVRRSLAARELTARHFVPRDRLPTLEDLRRGVECFREGACNLVLGIGGGRVLDVAKALAVVGGELAPPRVDLATLGERSRRTTGLVLAPTTAGSGSEATRFAVLYVDGIKHSLDAPCYLADLSIVDPRLVHSVPGPAARAAHLDALCQCLESLWAVRATPSSRELARRGLALAWEQIAPAARGDAPAQRQMALAAHLSGRAINVSRTTGPHAVSYPLTSRFGVPHGHAVALTVAEFIRFNLAEPRQAPLLAELNALTGTSGVEGLARRWRDLLRSLGLATRLTELNIGARDHEVILREGFHAARMTNNPRSVTREDLRDMLRRIA